MQSREAPCPCRDCADRRLGCHENYPHGWQDWQHEHEIRRDKITEARAMYASAKAIKKEGIMRTHGGRRK